MNPLNEKWTYDSYDGIKIVDLHPSSDEELRQRFALYVKDALALIKASSPERYRRIQRPFFAPPKSILVKPQP